MAEQDLYDKITELTNERDELRAKVAAGDQAQAKLSNLEGEFATLGRDYDAQSRRIKELKDELRDAKNAASNAETSKAAAEDALRDTEGEVSELRERVEQAEGDVRAARDALLGTEAEFGQVAELNTALSQRLKAISEIAHG